MGQYWKVVNLDKHEYIHPHKLGTGMKLWEQLANHPGTGAALIVLCAAMPEARGGGDFDLRENWHGPERDMRKREYWASPAEFPAGYQELASVTIGRWAGDRIALVGDYAEDTDLKPGHRASTIYALCTSDPEDREQMLKEVPLIGQFYDDISWMVAAVIEHELHGKYQGDGWRSWVPMEPVEEEPEELA